MSTVYGGFLTESELKNAFTEYTYIKKVSVDIEAYSIIISLDIKESEFIIEILNDNNNYKEKIDSIRWMLPISIDAKFNINYI